MDQIFLLLGDTRRRIRSVGDWVRESELSFEESRSKSRAGLIAKQYEHACALMHDSRLLWAREQFESVASSKNPEYELFARIGYGWTLNQLLQYSSADYHLTNALEEAASRQEPLLEVFADCFHFLNRSDWGRVDKCSQVNHSALDGDPEFCFLVSALRSYITAMHALRKGSREDALEATAGTIHAPRFESISPVLRGEFLRLHGILLAISGDRAAGRDNLWSAIGIFKGFAYQLGEVRTSLSLARIHTSMDQRRTEEHLNYAHSILEQVRSPLSSASEEQHMPGEWATYYSCKGDLERAAGNLDRAIDFYDKDLLLLRRLSDNSLAEDFPRKGAYAYRNLGRAHAAKRSFKAAATHFYRSSELFESVADAMNSFFSMVGTCDAFLEQGNLEQAQDLLGKMNDILAKQTYREKENAMVELLYGRLLWLRDNDDLGALRSFNQAVTVFSKSRDYFYVRTLMSKADVLILSSGDKRTARKCLLEAHRVANYLDIGYLVEQLDLLLARLGERTDQLTALATTDLERQCDVQGFYKSELTVMFADIRGFTDCCLKIDPDVMAAFIGELTDEICRYTAIRGGQPLSFLGDSVMAIFGVQGRRGSMKEFSALRAACEIYDRFLELRSHWAKEEGQLEEVGLGFGLATGETVAGRFGKKELEDFSVIGNAVNLAARLQSAAEDGEVLICEATERAIRGARPYFKSVSEVLTDLKGIREVQATRLSVLAARPHLNSEDIGETISKLLPHVAGESGRHNVEPISVDSPAR